MSVTHSKRVNAIVARPVVFPTVMAMVVGVGLVAEVAVPVFAMHSKRVNAIAARPVAFPTVMVVEVVPSETSVTATTVAANLVPVTLSNVVNVIAVILAVIPTMVVTPVVETTNPVNVVLVGCAILSKRANVTVVTLVASLTKLLRTTRSFIPPTNVDLLFSY